MKAIDKVFLIWVALLSCLALAAFGYDKLRARQGEGRRVPEWRLLLLGALGGWPGSMAGMLLFRHKTAKLSFLLKHGCALLVWLGLLYAWWQVR